MSSDYDDAREFKITTKEVWRDMQEFRNETREEASEVRQLLSKIDAKLDVALVSVEHSSKAVADHEARIRVIEKAVWRAAGAAAFLGGIAGIIVNQITK